MSEHTTEAPAQDGAQESAQERAAQERAAQQAAQQRAAQRNAALHTNAQGKAEDAHVRTEYASLDEVEAARKAARRPADEARTAAAYEPYAW
ncbi:hypothetical protein I5H01_gp005 [Mycobacterium phage MarkPhew]|uniref:Uncharacterized protein n=1 Tax=Mycobacterium phage MarkPhew TaxID=2725625 RepID=A0A6M3SZH2_9CAUD|nr:hypothetical protein I5H01_gp005 [Mycobacterium phage MarkPhew]QJD50402.1 hypothetical protein SEA_MARKPHEW_102 [Mycobacterium phage MarkPhew]